MPRATAAAAKPAVKKPKASKSAHKLSKPLPEGTKLTDFTKKGVWKLGKPIGSGGFGLIYLTDRESPGAVSDQAQYVMKLEPYDNGPLFCELSFYQRAAKPDMVKAWTESQKLASLGMPVYVASGMHENAGSRYRFMVMQRFGTDLQKLFEANGNRFSPVTVYSLALQLLDVLEYIHSQDYVHADIKASNLLLDSHTNTNNNHKQVKQVYLVDFGLATKYCSGDEHKAYKEDPRRTHDGTIEFTSIDAHKGVGPSRRGDMEILGYCLLQWLCQRLPWEDKLEDKEYVRDQKIKHMKNIPALMKTCFPEGDAPDVICKYLEFVKKLDYQEKPDYNKFRQMFKKALKSCGCSESGKLDFTTATPAKPKVTKSRKRTQDSMAVANGASPPKIARVSLKTTPKKKATSSRGTPKAQRSGSKSSSVEKSPSAADNPSDSNGVSRSQALAGSSGDAEGSSAKKLKPNAKKKAVLLASHATQTSPGLKGLCRSRKK